MAKVVIIDLQESPLQKLMNYIFENYCELKEPCKAKGFPVDTETCVKCVKDSWYDGFRQYECDNFKRVYLIRYLAVQIGQITYPIKVSLLRYIKGIPQISAISLGGGPGTEAIALIDGLRICEGIYNITFENIDGVVSWGEIYNDLASRFEEQVENINLESKFVYCDVTCYKSGKLFDLVFISWVLSDMDKRKDWLKILEVAKNIVKPNGYILVSDRADDIIIRDISSTLREIGGLEIYREELPVSGHCGIVFPQNVKDTFGPRIGMGATYWVLRKP
ncbi:hypothetical protein ACFLY3_01705 [Chloroflexota bacterium]